MMNLGGWQNSMVTWLKDELYIVSKECTINFVNREDYTVFGLKATEIVGTSFFDLPFTLTNECTYNKTQLKDLCIKNSSVNLEFVATIQLSDQKPKWYRFNLQTEVDKQGDKFLLITLSDITETQLLEQRLNSERSLFIGGPTVVVKWVPRSTWVIDYVSPNIYQQFGYQPEALMRGDFSFISLVHPDDFRRLLDEVEDFKEKKRLSYEQEYRLRHANGTYRYVYDYTTVSRDEYNEIVSYQGTIVDVTEKTQAIINHNENLERFNSIIEGITDSVLITDELGTITFCNNATSKVFKWDIEELVGQPLDIIIPQNNFGQNADGLRMAQLSSIMGTKPEMVGLGKYGNHLPLEVSVSSWKKGNNINYSWIISDLTERKAKEERIKHLASFPESSKNPIVEIDIDGNVLYANPTAMSLFTGINRAGKLHPFLLGIETNMQYRDVEYEGKWYRQSIKFYDDRQVLRVYSMDITENILMQEAARINEARLSSLIESIPDAVFLKDGTGKWQHINSVAKAIFRLENIDWKGKDDTELAILNADMKDIHDYCVVSDNDSWGKGVVSKGEEYVPDRGGVLHYYDVIKVPIFNKNNEREALVIVGREITEQKLIEHEKSLNHMIQEQINKILKVSLSKLSIKDSLDAILEIVISSDFINLQKQGGIFLTDETKQSLSLVSHANFAKELLTQCNKVAFGRCLCGKAAQSGEVMFVDCVNELHENTYEGIKQHGHYSVPIITGDEVIGVIVVYLNHGHPYSIKEVRFLESVADIIGGMISRKKAEEQVISSIQFLERLDIVNSILQKTSGHEDIGDMNREMLEAIIKIFAVDSVWLIYPCDPDVEKWLMPYECINMGNGEYIHNAKEVELPQGLRHLLVNALECNDTIALNKVNDKEILDLLQNLYGVKSVMYIALHPQIGKPWIMGVHQRSYAREWTREEKNLFRQIAERYSYSLNSYLLLDQLKKSELQYRSLSETARDIIVSYDMEGNIHYMNNVGLEFFGLQESTYIGRNIFEFINNAREDIYRRLKDRKAGIKTTGLLEVTLVNCNGETIPFEVNSSFIDLDGGVKGMISVNRNIAERKMAEDRLIAKNTELQTINSELDRFVYSTSHDLRSPLTSVLGLINISREETGGSPDLKLYLDMMEKSIHRLDNVIKSILDYSKSNRVRVNLEPLSMQTIYSEVLESISYIKGHETIKHICDIDVETVFASDKIRITTIISNLINNAIKYRRQIPDSIVKFTFKANEKEGVITVEDNGEGIPESKFQLIFEMFYRNSNSAEGSGLGLYIVKQNAAKLNGTVDLKSTPGKGSKFTITIPNGSGEV